MVDRDGIVSQSEDTVKLAEREREPGLLGRLGKVLILDDKITDGDSVPGNEALKRA